MSRLFTHRLFLLPTLLTALLLGAGSEVNAQQTSPIGKFGNEWIEAGQPYYKIKVGQRGIHRLTNAWLTAAGVPLTTLDPRRLQLWRRGQEQAIYVAGEADGTFNAADYVDFWGAPNDGLLEREMYKNPSEQASQVRALYADTAAYFLTIAAPGTATRRMPALTSNPTGLTPVRHHVQQLVQSLATAYERGKVYDDVSLATMPWLDKNEGFQGPRFAYRLNANAAGVQPPPVNGYAFTITLPAPFDSTHFTPYADIMVASTLGWQPRPFKVNIATITGTGSAQVITVIRSTPPYPSMPPYGYQLLRVPLQYSDFSATGVLGLQVILAADATDFSTLSGLNYARLAAAAPNALGGQSRLFATDSTLGGASQYLLFDTAPAAAVAYDVTDPTTPVRITGQTAGAQWGVVVPTPSAIARQVFVANDAAPRVPAPGRAVGMRVLTPRPGAYLIVTGKQVVTDTSGIRPVRDYAAYRASPLGGGHDTVSMVMDQLYNVFHYGDASPNAIRRFASFMSSGPAPAGFLFLIGKGHEPVPVSGILATIVNFRILFNTSVVPPFGYPASDIAFTADFRNDQYAPRIPTGRIAAISAAEVAGYLDKVRAHEAAPLADWRKEVLHLGGGRVPSEQVQFRGYLANYARRVEDSVFFGGHVTSILRGNTSQTVTEVNVSAQVNRGLALITFFGHSSPNTSEIDVGRASDALANYRNVGRYPFMLMNGCASGNAFVPTPPGVLRSFGEDWVLTPRHGAIGFLAYGGFGYPDLLNMYSTAFYRAIFNDSTSYGRTIGEQQLHAVELALPPLLMRNENGISMAMAMILQTDPATRIFSPAKPDYAISDTTVSLRALPGERLTARASGLQVVVRVRNYGKAIRDSVRVQVRRTYGGMPVQVVRAFQPVFYGDTLVFTLPNPPAAAAQGSNTFDVFVDYPDSVSELNEQNNRVTLTYSFPSGSVFPLFPQEFAIIPNTTPGLVGEYDQPLAQNREYTFELDTVPSFSSPILVRQLITAGRYPLWRPTLPATPGQDSVAWYWRFRPQTILPGEDSTWATSSFRHISASLGGWSQSHHGQFARDQKVSISQATPSGKWRYSPTLLRMVLRTQSGDSIWSTRRTFSVPPDGIGFNGSTGMRPTAHINVPNVFVMVFDPRDLTPVTIDDLIYNGRFPLADPSSAYGQDNGLPGFPYNMFNASGGVGTSPVRVGLATLAAIPGSMPVRYNPVLTGRVDSIAKLIERVPTGYIVALVTANRVPFDEMRAQNPVFLNALKTLGARMVDSLHSGDPYVIVGTKGGVLGSASEKTYDRSRPVFGQTVILDTSRQTNEPRGEIRSTVIGPVQQWREVVQTVRRESATSQYKLSIVPIDVNGQDGPPVPVPITPNPLNSTSSFSLMGAINPVVYPKARLVLATEDTVFRRAPQLEQWLVTYDGVPEGIVRPDSIPASALNLDAQVERGSVRLRVPFQNISTVPFRDSVTAEFSVLYATSRTPVTGMTLRRRMAALRPDALGWAAGQFVTTRLATGNYLLHVEVNPGRMQPEQYDFNNSFEAPFRVVNPNLAPLVDVAFDGQHILYGDIVAPSPVITISVRDEDKNIPLDPQNVTMKLTRPGQAMGEQIPINSPQIRIQAATATKPLLITYEPGRLADGKYRLDVQATDAAGNLAGTEAHKSEFQVINETMISNFYPYPNPFSTNTRFLFTITGKVPQNLKIQIMTVTGKVVREITKEELGTDLRVGNNAGTLPWNGTDEYGDALANGVYLYRVVVQDDTENFKSFRTAGDSKAFHKTWGKLYILR